MNALLRISRLIDALTERIGAILIWLVLIIVALSAGNAVMRKFDMGSNAFLEGQWYLFSAIFLLGSGYTFLRNEHIRIDLITSRLSPQGRAWVDVFGIVFLLMPMALFVLWLSWPIFMHAWLSQEYSPNPGGLILWPVRLLVPAGFFLLSLQGISELIKRIGFILGRCDDPAMRHVKAHPDLPNLPDVSDQQNRLKTEKRAGGEAR